MEDCERTIEWDFEKISKLSGVSEKTVELIKKFDKENRAEGIKPITRKNYIQCLRLFLETAKKPIEDITKDDLVNFFSGGKRKEGTLNLFRESLTRFYRWQGDGELPETLKGARKLLKQNGGVSEVPKDLLDAEDVKKIAAAATNSRDRLIPLFLFEGAARIGEALNAKIGDVSFDEYGCKVRVTGKTGSRVLRVVNCAPLIRQCIEDHPYKNDKTKPLFCQFKENKRNGTEIFLTQQYARKLIKMLAKRAGIEKRVNPHSFRHAALTIYASELGEFELKQFAGWSPASPCANIYVHGTNLDQKMLANRGLIDLNGKAEKKETLKLIACPACQTKNGPVARFCYSCSQPLDIESINEYKDRQMVKSFLDWAHTQPEGKKFLDGMAERYQKKTEVNR